MTDPSRLGDFFWKAEGCCASLRNWRSGSAAELRSNRVDNYTEITLEEPYHCYVAELAHAKVIGNAKLVSTTRDIVLGDIQFLYGADDPASHWILRRRRFMMPVDVSGTSVVVAASNAENYYHWLFDSLPRLHLLTLAGYALAEIDHFLLDHSARSFQIESLDHLGIPEAKILHCSKRGLTKCSRLIVPSMPGPLGYPPRWVCDFLRNRFVPENIGLPKKKVYVSRRHARGRKIVNEADILPALVRHGYEIVCTERMTFLEQVALFASAEQVVSMHGAGMSNIVFAPPGAKVLELGSRLHNNLSFRTLAANCDLRYDHLYLDTAPGAERANTRFANVVVDPEEFPRKLEAISR